MATSYVSCVAQAAALLIEAGKLGEAQILLAGLQAADDASPVTPQLEIRASELPLHRAPGPLAKLPIWSNLTTSDGSLRTLLCNFEALLRSPSAEIREVNGWDMDPTNLDWQNLFLPPDMYRCLTAVQRAALDSARVERLLLLRLLFSSRHSQECFFGEHFSFQEGALKDEATKMAYPGESQVEIHTVVTPPPGPDGSPGVAQPLLSQCMTYQDYYTWRASLAACDVLTREAAAQQYQVVLQMARGLVTVAASPVDTAVGGKELHLQFILEQKKKEERKKADSVFAARARSQQQQPQQKQESEQTQQTQKKGRWNKKSGSKQQQQSPSPSSNGKAGETPAKVIN